MRHIPTSAVTVETLKKQAKRLRRSGSGKHSDLLDRVARTAGYEHWHHVQLCLKATEDKRGLDALNSEFAIIERAVRDGITKVIVTGPELQIPALLLFAHDGDAWMVDPDGDLVMCLAWHGANSSHQPTTRSSNLQPGLLQHWYGRRGQVTTNRNPMGWHFPVGRRRVRAGHAAPGRE